METFQILLISLAIFGQNCLGKKNSKENSKQKSAIDNEQPRQQPVFIPGFPPDVLAVLPQEAIKQIQTIQMDQSLSPMEKADRIDAVFTDQPPEVLNRIPDPPNFAGLPEEVKQHIRQLFRQKGKSFGAKNVEFKEYVDSLPEDQQKIIKSPHPLPMPPALRDALPAETISQIDKIHANEGLTNEQKIDQIDALISALPETILDKIPEPTQYSQLPEEVKRRLKAIKRQKGKPFSVKNQEFIEYVKTLPEEQQVLAV